MRILIVDDENQALDAMASFLADPKVEIVSVTDSTEAAKQINSQHFDAMFIDFVMPPPNGMELMRMARISPLNQGTPIILVTGYDDIETRNKGAEEGATSFLAKPFTPQMIRNVLKSALFNIDSSKAPGVHLPRESVAF